jgi:hypothetical protein
MAFPEQNDLHPRLPGAENVPETVVSDENRLFGADPQPGQGGVKKPHVRLR